MSAWGVAWGSWQFLRCALYCARGCSVQVMVEGLTYADYLAPLETALRQYRAGAAAITTGGNTPAPLFLSNFVKARYPVWVEVDLPRSCVYCHATSSNANQKALLPTHNAMRQRTGTV